LSSSSLHPFFYTLAALLFTPAVIIKCLPRLQLLGKE